MKISTLIICQFILFTSFGQTPNFEWVNQYASAGVYGNIYHCVATDNESNMITYGTFIAEDFDVDFSDEEFYLDRYEAGIVYLCKYDENEALIWAKNFGGFGYSFFTEDVVTDDFNNIYVLGSFATTGYVDFDPSLEDTTFTETPTADKAGFISKFSADGEFQWVKVIEAESHVFPKALTIDNFGNPILIGKCHSPIDLDPGPDEDISDIIGLHNFVIKLDSNGDYLWGGTYEGYEANDIDVDFANNVFIGGNFTAPCDFDLSPTDAYVLTPDLGCMFTSYILRLDEDGAFISANSLGGIERSSLTGLRLDRNGDLIVAGYYKNAGNFDLLGGDYSLTTVGELDFYVVKYSNDLELLWGHSFGSEFNEYALKVAIGRDGEVAVAGEVTDLLDLDPTDGENLYETSGETGTFITFFSEYGAYNGSATYNDITVQFLDICSDQSGTYYWNGKYEGTIDVDHKDGTLEITNGIADRADYFWVKLKQEEVSGLNEFPQKEKNGFVCYPNPASEQLFIQSKSEVQSVLIFDLYGNLVQQETSKSFLIHGLSAGVYLIIVKNQSGSSVSRFVKK